MKIAAFVEETTATTGTGALTLAGATVGRRPFSVLPDGSWVPYAIEASDGSVELGIGQLSATGTALSRNSVTILSSTTGGTLNLPVGTHTVRLADPGPMSAWRRGAVWSDTLGESCAAASTTILTMNKNDKDTDGGWLTDQMRAPEWCSVAQFEFVAQFNFGAAAAPPDDRIRIKMALSGFDNVLDIERNIIAVTWQGLFLRADVHIVTGPIEVTDGLRGAAQMSVINESSAAVDMTANTARFAVHALA